MGKYFYACAVCAIFLLGKIRSGVTYTYEEFTTLDKVQQQRLGEFRSRVAPSLPQEYMKSDVFLLRFLRANDFDLEKTQTMLEKTLKWREKNKIATILSEDWNQYDDEYKSFWEGCDRDGRPIISFPVGQWNLRKPVFEGNSEKLKRHFLEIMEEAFQMLRSMDQSGEKAAQVTYLYDMDGFNFHNQGCVPCLPVITGIFDAFGQNYPELAHRIYVMNVPQLFMPFIGSLRQIFPPGVSKIVEIYAKNDARAVAALLTEIDPSQLTRKHGGTSESPVDFHDIRIRILENRTVTCSDPSNSVEIDNVALGGGDDDYYRSRDYDYGF